MAIIALGVMLVVTNSAAVEETKKDEPIRSSYIYVVAVKSPLEFKLSLREYMEREAVILGVNPVLANCLITIESGWNPYAQNPISSAYGLGQFINSTWYRTEQRMGVDLDRDDPYDQIDAFLWLLKTDGYRHWIVWPSCV